MINFEKFTLKNGLRVIFHQDESTPMVAVNIMYDVGAKDENPEQTGFAHLFEHLMFGGSENIPEYDEPLQNAGGENNAYTTNDLTNYYLQLPKQNLETAFWLESDRMKSLAFSSKSLDVQRKVVCEEFKEHYINKPYGDVWQYLRELCYKSHPYQWMTIGKKLAHIEDAKLEDVKSFFFKHYRPQNAVLAVAGNTTLEEVKKLAEKWFEPIDAGEKYFRNIPAEPKQTEARVEKVYKKVPVSVLYKAYPISNRLSKNYYVADLITEIFGGGKSALLYHNLVKEQKVFSSIDCYHTGSVEEGLLVFSGKIAQDIDAEKANEALEKVINDFLKLDIKDSELEKAKNKIESMLEFEDMSLLNRAASLSFYELIMNDASKINEEWKNYNAVSIDEIKEIAKDIFFPEKMNTLYYLAEN
ncbi:MAG: insulinase family protein [Chitinophagaceae bacterium]|nr:insulinase family protein [Chitinophagaceae bacterium]